ncbi:MAG: carboxymuconolactone decarboxylase family protein [Acidimicrobiales bacterium]
MARIEPLPREELPQHEPIFKMVESAMGFVPSSMLTMAKAPGLLEAFGGLAGTIGGMGAIDRGLSQMIANMVSNAAGCRYCQAHTATHAAHAGVDADKVAAIWEFETNELFSEAERAALRVARDAAQIPNATTDEQFAALAQHFDEQQVIQIVATISMFGYLNRWNDTMATTLEAEPLGFANQHLAANGWEAGKHAGE